MLPRRRYANGFDTVLTSHPSVKTRFEPLLQQFVQKPEYGLFVIDERLVSESIDSRLREMERGLDLVFVIMPPPLKMEGKREDYAVRLLRKAIGYHIQLNI